VNVTDVVRGEIGVRGKNHYVSGKKIRKGGLVVVSELSLFEVEKSGRVGEIRLKEPDNEIWP